MAPLQDLLGSSFVLLAVPSFVCFITLPLYLIGRIFFSALILKTPNKMPARLFGLTFAASGAMLVLVLLEIYGAVAARARFVLWRLHLVTDLVLVVLVLPFLLCVQVVRRSVFSGSQRFWPAALSHALAVVPTGAWLWCFYKVGEPFPVRLSAASSSLDWLGTLAAFCLSRAGVIGVVVSAVMSGSGAINGPATSLRRLVRGVDARELEAGKRGMLHAVDLVAKHRLRLRHFGRRLAALRHKDALDRQKAAAAWRQVGSWGDPKCFWCGLAWAHVSLPLLLRSPAYSEASGELRSARAEDRALRAALRRQLVAFEHLLDDQQRAAFASSLKGKGYNVLGYVFSGYCVYKVVFACRAIVLKGGAAVTPTAAASAVSSAVTAAAGTSAAASVASAASAAGRRRRRQRRRRRRPRPTAPPPRAPSLLHSWNIGRPPARAATPL